MPVVDAPSSPPPVRPEARTGLRTGALAALAAALIGGGWQVASRQGVTTSLGPLELAVLRYGLPALVLGMCWPWLGPWPALRWWRMAPWLVLGGGLPFGLLVLAGAVFAPAAHMGVFLAGTMPVFSALLAWRIDGERIGPSRRWGLGLVVCGVFLLGAGQFAGAGGIAGAWRGDLLFVLASLSWALYTLALRRAGLGPWQAAAVVNIGSALLLLPLVGAMGVPRLFSAPWRDLLLQGLWQGVVAGLLGLWVYGVAVARLGAARAALSAALVPLLSLLGGAWVLGERPAAADWVAALVVASGVALASGAFGRHPQSGG